MQGNLRVPLYWCQTLMRELRNSKHGLASYCEPTAIAALMFDAIGQTYHALTLNFRRILWKIYEKTGTCANSVRKQKLIKYVHSLTSLSLSHSLLHLSLSFTLSLFCTFCLPYSRKFSRDPIFAEGHSAKISSCNFRGW